MARDVRRDGAKEVFWRRMVRGQARSGWTVRDYCRRHRLAESGFYWWRRQLADRPGKMTFVPVQVRADRPAACEARIEILLEGGRWIGLQGPVDRQRLSDVLAVLEARPC